MRYESESGLRLDAPSADEIDESLGQLDGEKNSFAYFTKPDGSYIQVGGGPTDFIVEVREYRTGGSFRHLRASRRIEPGSKHRLTIGGANVSVRTDQILDLQSVRQLF